MKLFYEFPFAFVPKHLKIVYIRQVSWLALVLPSHTPLRTVAWSTHSGINRKSIQLRVQPPILTGFPFQHTHLTQIFCNLLHGKFSNYFEKQIISYFFF